jgi:hypothetical protein
MESTFVYLLSFIPGMMSDREDKTGGAAASVKESLGVFGATGLGMVVGGGESAVAGEFYNARKDAQELLSTHKVKLTVEGERETFEEKKARIASELAAVDADAWQTESALAYIDADHEIQKKNRDVMKKVKDILSAGNTIQDPEVQGLLNENYVFALDYYRRVYKARSR